MNLLFLCTGNSCRSQIAEGWAQHLGDGRPRPTVEAPEGGLDLCITPRVRRELEPEGDNGTTTVKLALEREGDGRDATVVVTLAERFLELQRIFVHPDHRGGGLGSRLVETLLEKAAAAGVQRSMVGSNNVDWRAIHRFYERHGFKMLSIDMYR